MQRKPQIVARSTESQFTVHALVFVFQCGSCTTQRQMESTTSSSQVRMIQGTNGRGERQGMNGRGGGQGKRIRGSARDALKCRLPTGSTHLRWRRMNNEDTLSLTHSTQPEGTKRAVKVAIVRYRVSSTPDLIESRATNLSCRTR